MRIERIVPYPARTERSLSLRCDYGKRICSLCMRKKPIRGGLMRNGSKSFHCAECKAKSVQL